MRLFYRKYGSGPTLVILHGLYGSSDNWISIAGKLSKFYTVIIPDLRNHGQSPHDDIHTYEALARDIYELTEDLKMDRFILAGHSMGGKAAMTFAFRWPDKLNGLIIVDISPSGSTSKDNPFFIEHKKLLEAIMSAHPERCTSREEIDKLLAEQIKSERTRGFIMKNLKRMPGGNFAWKLNVPVLLRNLPEITKSVTGNEETIIPVTGFPVIFIRGGDSNYIQPDRFEEITRIFPVAEIITVPGTGHWIHADKPDAIADIFLRIRNN